MMASWLFPDCLGTDRPHRRWVNLPDAPSVDQSRSGVSCHPATP